MDQKHIAIVEATTSGAGLEVLHSAVKNNHKVTFIVQNLEKYKKSIKGDIFERINLVNCDTSKESELEKAILNLQAASPINGLLTLTDGKIEIVSRIASKLGLTCMNPSAVSNARNKDKTREICENLNLRTPKFHKASNIEEAEKAAGKIGYPVIVKSSKGTGSTNVELCKNEKELNISYNKISTATKNQRCSILIEEFLVGPLVSVESISLNGKVNFLGFTDRTLGPLPHFVEVSYSFPISLGENLEVELKKYTKEVLETIGMDNGATHTEFIITDKGPVLVEVNPRLGGGMLGPMISEALGIDLYNKLIQVAFGEKPDLNLSISKGCSTTLVYSHKHGYLKSIDHTVALKSPGVKEVFLSKESGDQVSPPEDFKGDIGFLWTEGETVELAASNCRYAANCILFDVD